MKFTFALVSAISVACASGAPTVSGSTKFDPRPSECQPSPPPNIGRVDIAIIFDTAISTGLPSGFDVDADGSVGSPDSRMVFSTSSEPGDSILAAQVRTARILISHFLSADVRFSIVTYSGINPKAPDRRTHDSLIECGLTSDPAVLAAALDRAQFSDSIGAKVFPAGMDAALESLEIPRGSPDSRRKIALFVSDDVYPFVLRSGSDPSRADPHMKEVAEKAISRGVRFHTFGVGA